MDIDERKIGEWPNVALVPGTHIHAATGEYVEQPENTRIGRSRGADGPEAAEPEQVPGEDGNEPEIGEIAWHREVVEGYHPSDCPYCGCKRVVIGEYEPCHDEEWEYYIEHKDAKEAIGRKCFTMYAAYKTPEDAVNGADMRVVRLAPAEARSGQQDGSECVDTLEKLEADLCKLASKWHNFDGNYMRIYSSVAYAQIKDLLDRRAAIAKREVFENGEYDCLTCGAKRELQQRVDSLTAERDDLLRITEELEERNGDLLEGRAHWIDQAVSIYRRFYPHDEYAVPDDVCSMVIAKIDELTAERDKLKRRLENQATYIAGVEANLCRYESQLVRDVKDIDKLTAERDELNAKLKEAEEDIRDLDIEGNVLGDKLAAAEDMLHVVMKGGEPDYDEWMWQHDGLNDWFRENFTKTVPQLEAEFEAQRKRANEAERGVLSEEWYVCRDRYEDDIAELTAERDELEHANKRQAIKIIAVCNLNDVMSKRIKELEAERDSLGNNLNSATEMLSKMQRECNELTAERDELQMQLLDNIDTDMAIENTQLHCEVNDLLEERDSLREKNSNQRRQLSELQDAIHERNEGVLKRQWQRRIDELTAERDEWQRTAEDYQNCYDMAVKRGQNRLSKINELTAERDRMQRVIDTQAESFKKLEAELKAANDTANTLRVSVAGLKETVENQKAEILRLKDENAELCMGVYGAPF